MIACRSAAEADEPGVCAGLAVVCVVSPNVQSDPQREGSSP
jgi:hypothetical protein